MAITQLNRKAAVEDRLGPNAIMATFTSQSWQIDLADGWETEQSKHCITICHPDGVGALQISSFQKRGSISRDDLLEATNLDENTQQHLGEKQWGEFQGFQLVYAVDDTFWRKWWLRENNILIFVTYNCAHQDKDVEITAVNQMVCSLRRS